MSKKKNTIQAIPVEYHEPDKYEGRCTICGKVNTTWDWDNTVKPAAFGEMYCYCVSNKTTHTNIKKVKS